MQANKTLDQEISRISPMLQLQLVNDVLAISTNDIPLQTKLISIIMHYYLPDINNYTQQKLYNHLNLLGNMINKSLKLDLTYLPEVVRASPVLEVLKVNIRQHESGVDKSNIFIYNPWKKGGATIADYNWMVGNVCYVKIYLRNVFEFEIFIDMIMLVTEGVKTINYPTSVIMNKTRSLHELTLKFKPLETGTINVLGVISKLSNFVHFHPINAKGIAIKSFAEDRSSSKDSFGIRNIPIKERVSTLKLWFEDTRDEIQLYEGSRFYTRALVGNKNECVMSLRKAQISFAFSDNTTLDKELNVADIDINQYDTFSVVVCRSLPEEEQSIRELYRMQNHILLNLYGIHNLDKLFKIYVKLIYYAKEKPGISIEDNITKEVKMLKGLSLTNLQIYNSIASEKIRVAGKDYKHISIDQCFYISFDVVRDDPNVNKNNYMLTIYQKGSEDALVEKLMLGANVTEKLIIKVDRVVFKDQKADLQQVKEMFHGRWKDLSAQDNGYLFIKNTDAEPLIEKIENLNLNVIIDVDMPENEDGNKEAKIGELYTMKANVKLSSKEKKKLHVSVIASELGNAEQALLTKSEKGILHKGKKTFLVEMGEGISNEITVSAKVMFMEKRQYKLFCFVMDEENAIVYSYKNPWYVVVN